MGQLQIQDAYRAVVKGELAKHGISEAEKAVKKFKLFHIPSEQEGASTDANINGGLQFSVSGVGACLDTLELDFSDHAKVRMSHNRISHSLHTCVRARPYALTRSITHPSTLTLTLP